jgi:uncharacterized membrane protein (UPF0127 family)
MKKGIRSAMLTVVLAVPAPLAVQAGSQVAPPATAIVESTAVKGDSGTQVVVYRQNGLRLGAVETAHGSQRLVWSRTLPAVPARLSSPGPKGLLVGIVRFPGSQKAQIFAYIVHSSDVVSAIPGRPSGEITAAEGANFHGLNFTLKEPDSSHVGSVKYRFETTYSWTGNSYVLGSRIHVPDYAKSAYPTPSATVTTKHGDTALMRLEIADTEPLRETGLMNRMSLDPDSGMVFVWPSPVLESFWMENTYIPLSIAFLGTDGKVQQILDMDPLTTVLHTPAAPYQYSIEANVGYFKSAGIVPGDTVNLHLTS